MASERKKSVGLALPMSLAPFDRMRPVPFHATPRLLWHLPHRWHAGDRQRKATTGSRLERFVRLISLPQVCTTSSGPVLSSGARTCAGVPLWQGECDGRREPTQMVSLDAGGLMKTQLPVRQTTRSGGKRAAPPPVRASNAPDEPTTSSVTPAPKAKVANQMVTVDEFSQPDATPPSAALRIVQSAVVFRALYDQGAQSSSARLDAAASPLRGRHRECGLEGKQQRQRSKEQKGRAALSCGPTPRPLAPRTCARPNPQTTLSHATCPLP